MGKLRAPPPDVNRIRHHRFSGRTALKANTLALAVAFGVVGPATAVRNDELQDLKAQIEALQKKIVELEQKQEKTEQKQAAAAPENVVTGWATRAPSSCRVEYVGHPWRLREARRGLQQSERRCGHQRRPVPGSDHDRGRPDGRQQSATRFGAREPRLFVKTSTPTSMGDLNTHVEFDFYGADGNESVSNSHCFRLRHVYGTLGNFLAGQTWTNFMNPASLPDTLDFGGPVGQIFDRQAQVRGTQTFGGSGSIASGQWSVGVENPETVVQIPGGASFRADDDRFPDITGQVMFNTSMGKISAHGLARHRYAEALLPAL